MNAVIYCRVSSKDQVDGTSLESQELACRDYALKQRLTVSKVFIEEGESAKFAARTQLLELLNYCRDKTHQIEILLVWKIDRFARNVEDHFTVKAALKRLGVRIVSVTEPIQADPNGKLMETILAGFAQFDNDIRALRTVQGMKQRLREGIWPWKPPLGYLPPRVGKKTQPDEADPRCFAHIQKAWKLFVTGAYTKADILRLLRHQGVRAYRGRPVTAQLLDHMFANPYYAGVLRDPWTGDEYAGQHVAMVTTIEFSRIQEIVASRNRSIPHHRLTETFPLRGQVRCPSCESLMTGYVAQGRSKRYPYYKCFRASCPTRTKSYSTASIHDEYFEHLGDTSIPHYLAESIITELVVAYWDRTGQARQAALSRKAELERVKGQLQELISMRSARLIADDEFIVQRKRIRATLIELQASQLSDADASLTHREIHEVAGILSNLAEAWRTMPTEAKQGFGGILFPVGYRFRGIRTAEKGLLFKATYASEGGLSHLVALTLENLNAIFADIRKLLAIVPRSETCEQEVA